MDNPFFMCTYNIFGKQHTHSKILAYFTCHIITLGGVDSRILIGVLLLGVFIDLIQQGEDIIICSIGFAGKFSFVTIAYIFLCYFVTTHLHNTSLYHILDIFYIDCMRGSQGSGSHSLGNCHDLEFAELMDLRNLFIGFLDRIYDFALVEDHFFAISLDNICSDLCFHAFPSFLSYTYILCTIV